MSSESITSQLSASDRPWLSVVVPIYNAKRFLKKCIRSILTQSFRDFELLLIDDGSTDGSEAICRRFAEEDPRVRYYRKENGGCFQSRLYGMERARGEYVLNCDADDYYLTRDAFQILHERAEQFPAKAYQFGCTHVYNHLKGITRPVPPEPLRCDGAEFSAKDYPILLYSGFQGSRLYQNIWSKLLHRSLLKQLPKADTAGRLFNGEDIVLNLHLLCELDAFTFLPDILYAYRQNGSSRHFSMSLPADLDTVKGFQLSFFARWKTERPDAVFGPAQIYTALATELFRFAVRGVGIVSDESLSDAIVEAFQLPTFQIARQFFLDNPQDRWWIVNLFIGADPQAYVKKAKEERKDQWLKKAIWRLYRRIYAAI